MRTSRAVLAGFLFLLVGGLILAPCLEAQTRPLEQKIVHHRIDSGVLVNDGSEQRVVFERVIRMEDAPWVRLSFEHVLLGAGSRLVISSLADGATQRLDQVALAQWQNTTAYFNGSAVTVRLSAGPGTINEFSLNSVLVGIVSPPIESQCGPTDDRVTSDEPERARLLDIGCSAAIYNTESCFITAGHCLSTGFLVDIAEFNVPASNANGSLNHPGPEDQYAVDVNGRQWVDGGVGNDWGLFRVFANSETGLMPYEAQGAHLTLADSVPGSGDVVIVGYGVDGGVDNQTQQVSIGPITGNPGTTLNYQADTEGGNSGSSVVENSTQEVVAIHTHGGCSVGGSGSNAGTQITKQALQDALATFCPVGAISLDSLVPSIAGQSNNWNYSGATPGEVVGVKCSAQGDPNDFQIGMSFADGNGDGTVVRTIPAGGSGRTIECHAIDAASGFNSPLAIFALQ